MARRRGALTWLVILAVIALVAAGCGDRDDDEGAGEDTGTETTDDTGEGEEPEAEEPDEGGAEEPEAEEPAADPCEGVTLEATEIGVTADTITVLVAADTGSPLAPGLFQDAIDAMKAWGEHVNADGGLGCRQVEVLEYDTVLNANESVNAQIQACDQAVAMVGTTALFVFDTETMASCPDMAGEATGIPEIPQLTTEVAHQCNPTTRPVVAPQGACPFAGGEREYTERVGHVKWFQENVNPDLTGVFLIPGDLPSTRQTSITTVRAMESIGVTSVGEFNISGSDLQPTFAEYIQAMRDGGANYGRSGSDYVSMVKFRSEAANQGFDAEIWECTIACYTQQFIDEAGAAAEDTYMTIFHLPFEDADQNEEMADFIEAVGEPTGFGINAWAAGVAFEEAVNAIVEAEGPNAITRSAILAQLDTFTEFDARGMLGGTNMAEGRTGPCYVLMQVQGGEFVRVHPEEPGTLDCDEGNLATVTIDAAAEAEKIS